MFSAGSIGDNVETPAPKPKAASKTTKSAAKKSAAAAPTAPAIHTATPPPAPNPSNGQHTLGMALTVRVEINLPSGGDQATYDAIFKSIRENLLSGNGA